MEMVLTLQSFFDHLKFETHFVHSETFDLLRRDRLETFDWKSPLSPLLQTRQSMLVGDNIRPFAISFVGRLGKVANWHMYLINTVNMVTTFSSSTIVE